LLTFGNRLGKKKSPDTFRGRPRSVLSCILTLVKESSTPFLRKMEKTFLKRDIGYMRRLICGFVLLFLCLPAQAQELWVSFGVAAGRPDHMLHVKSDGTVEGRKYGDGYTMDLGANGAKAFFGKLKRQGVYKLPEQFPYDDPDCLSFMLTFEESGKRVELSGGSSKNSQVKAVYETTWALFEKMVREGEPRR
jgi:hypothetical protein